MPAVRRVVLVGNKISPAIPRKAGWNRGRTLWGSQRAAARRGSGRAGRATASDVLRELFIGGPCLVLIDGVVAYARRLHDQSDRRPAV